MPAFLANDILRLWRTFCVNYEARTSDVPPEKKNKRRLKNYKLKYSRMLTCYSALVYLLALHNAAGTVSPEDVRGMVARSPTERLEWLLTLEYLKDAHGVVGELLDKYSEFLGNTNETDCLPQRQTRSYLIAASPSNGWTMSGRPMRKHS